MKTLIVLLLICVSHFSYAETAFSKYQNARFNYQVNYPAFLIPQGEVANGDGQAFIGQKATMRVYGGFYPNLDSQKDDNKFSIPDEFNHEKTSLQKEGYKLDYTFLKGNKFVISGANDKQIVYFEKIYVAKCGVHLYLWIYYPKEQEKQWNALIPLINKSFKYQSTTCQGDYLISSNYPM